MFALALLDLWTIFALAQAKAKIAGGLTLALHSAVSELFIQPLHNQPFELPASSYSFKHCVFYPATSTDPFETIETEMQKNSAMSITGLETKTVKEETSLNGEWGHLLQPTGEAWFLDEAAAVETINIHGKIFRLHTECINSDSNSKI